MWGTMCGREITGLNVGLQVHPLPCPSCSQYLFTIHCRGWGRTESKDLFPGPSFIHTVADNKDSR